MSAHGCQHTADSPTTVVIREDSREADQAGQGRLDINTRSLPITPMSTGTSEDNAHNP